MQPLEAADPRAIGEYRLLRRLGTGGMGRVYLGRSPGGRTVAVKAVHPHFATDTEFRVRFRREVESARRVGGDWTAPVLDADPDAAVPWVATGYVAGPSLHQAVAAHGPLPEPTVRALGAGLAEALTAVHALGLVHRDVKPSNVLLTLDGPRLIDFGIARATDGTTGLTSTGVSIGSPGYMSPEQVLGRGGVGPPSDVFSLGAVLAYAATGTAPFPGESSAALLYHVVHEEPDLGGLPAGEVRELITGCLAKEAAERPTPEAVLRALAGAEVGADAEGAAAAPARAGWLPGPLVEQVSRSAVALLEMEAEDAHAAPDAAATQPVAPTEDGPSVSGLVPFADTAVHGTEGPTPAGAAAPTGRGGFSVSASATTGGGGDGRGGNGGSGGRSVRQLSCTLVLSVVGAVAVALLAVGIVFDLMPGGGAGQNAGDSAQPPAAADSPSSDQQTDDADGAVPEAFLGTWKGQLTTDDGLPAGILTITVAQAEPGEQVATGRFVRAITGERCRVKWELTSATGTELRVAGASFGAEGACAAQGGGGVLRLGADGDLRFRPAGDAPAGQLRPAD